MRGHQANKSSIYADHLAGLSHIQIANKHCVTAKTVGRILSLAGASIPRGRPPGSNASKLRNYGNKSSKLATCHRQWCQSQLRDCAIYDLGECPACQARYQLTAGITGCATTNYAVGE